jgi:chromodomain-helicase-DNA-binding protein 1
MERNQDGIRQQEQQTKKKLTKKDIKAVMFDFGEVKKINAETILDRPPQQHLLRRILNDLPDFRTFRLSEATKPAHYSCEWGALEDGMLLVGIDRYGFGAWAQIRDDRDLGLYDKFFLEEHRIEKKQEREHTEHKGAKAPGAVHLVRRAEYLLSVLTSVHSDDANAQKSVENHHRNNKKAALALANGHRRGEKTGSISASPVPRDSKKGSHRDGDRSHSRGEHHRPRSSIGESGTPRPDSKRKHSGDLDDRRHKQRRVDEHRRGEVSQREEEEDDARNAPVIEALMQPIWSHVEKVESCTKANIPGAKARAKVLKSEITAIGDFIEGLHKSSGLTLSQLEELKPKLWRFISKRLPASEKQSSGKPEKEGERSQSSSMTGPRLSALYQQLKQQSQTKDGATEKTSAVNGTSASKSAGK